MSGNIIQLNEQFIHNELKTIVKMAHCIMKLHT